MSLKISPQTIKHLECNSFKCNSIQTICQIQSLSLSKSLHKRKIPSLSSIHCNLSIPTLPKTNEDAINLVSTCLTTALQKPLNDSRLAAGESSNKLKQPRFRVEFPIFQDSPEFLPYLAEDVFDGMSVRRNGPKVKMLLIWPDSSLNEKAVEAFDSKSSDLFQHITVSSNAETESLNAADLAVFLEPEASQLKAIEAITDKFYPRPVVIFNPKWSFEEEKDFGNLSGFVGSFEVIYSLMGLEVRLRWLSFLSKCNALVFKCVRDGNVSGEKWNVLVEEGEDLRVVKTYEKRPAIDEVKNVLNYMLAMNSPIMRSYLFFKGLVSNITVKK